VIQTWFHQATADELGDGRIDDGYSSWLTFFAVETVFDALLLAQHVVFSNNGILANGVRLFWAG